MLFETLLCVAMVTNGTRGALEKRLVKLSYRTACNDVHLLQRSVLSNPLAISHSSSLAISASVLELKRCRLSLSEPLDTLSVKLTVRLA